MKTRQILIRSLSLQMLLFCLLDGAMAFADQVTVTTYVTRVQDERQSTRWTLTEWLRVKERMKLMDVWMAMFSDPGKDRFQPELNLSWLITRSAMERRAGDATSVTEGSGSGHTGRAQFWMTNLVSSTLGVRSLNIDFGVEGGQHDSGAIKEPTGATSINGRVPRATSTWYSANFRLFGKSIQDTSLIVKYGMLQTHNTLQLPDDTTVTSNNQRSDSGLATGSMAGAELQLYLTHWLGAEGTYHHYMPHQVPLSDHRLTGDYVEGLAFIEISVLRLMAGRYEERWEAKWDTIETKSREWGYIAGVKVQI
jgi:hypothetical protein